MPYLSAYSLKLILICILLTCFAVSSCNSEQQEETAIETPKKKVDYIKAIPGDNEEVSDDIIQRGKVLISYSDCDICHKEESKVIGPAFSDISLRYPRNEVFISILAQRIILGATGAWGHAVMTPHPSLSKEDAESMVSYILSIEKR